MRRKSAFAQLDEYFEKIITVVLRFYTSSFAIIGAIILVIIYLIHADFMQQNVKETIRDIMTCTSFIIYFMVQKSVSRYSLAIQIKLDELVASHEKASNEIVSVEQKTEQELEEIARRYREQQKQNIETGAC
jgi:low affinity Fe/Cu permease